MGALHTVKYGAINECYDARQASDAAKIANAILYEVEAGAYKKGSRNNIAVDLTCVCHVLGLDPVELFKERSTAYYTPASNIIDFERRSYVVQDYLDSWDQETYGVFDKMFTDINDIDDDRVGDYIELV